VTLHARSASQQPDGIDEKMNFCTKAITAAATELSDGNAGANGKPEKRSRFLHLSALSMAEAGSPL
jgi:hypothetical protein